MVRAFHAVLAGALNTPTIAVTVARLNHNSVHRNRSGHQGRYRRWTSARRYRSGHAGRADSGNFARIGRAMAGRSRADRPDAPRCAVHLDARTDPGEMTVAQPNTVEYWAATSPDATAFIEGDRRLSWAELNDAANRLAHGLAARGVVAGDIVVVRTQIRIEWPISGSGDRQARLLAARSQLATDADGNAATCCRTAVRRS